MPGEFDSWGNSILEEFDTGGIRFLGEFNAWGIRCLGELNSGGIRCGGFRFKGVECSSRQSNFILAKISQFLHKAQNFPWDLPQSCQIVKRPYVCCFVYEKACHLRTVSVCHGHKAASFFPQVLLGYLCIIFCLLCIEQTVLNLIASFLAQSTW